MEYKPKNIRVPFEDIKVMDTELAVINTPCFQRLFDIKQLGLAYMVYPGATHTRALHSIHSLGISEKFLRAIEEHPQSKPIITEEIRAGVRMASLIHDLGHRPFSHMLEDENGVFSKEDSHDGQNRLKESFNALREEIHVDDADDLFKSLRLDENTRQKAIKDIDMAENILNKIHNWKSEITEEDKNTKQVEDLFCADIVGNTISADLLSYTWLDSQFTGIGKEAGSYRLFNSLELQPMKIGTRETMRLAVRITKAGVKMDIIDSLLDILDLRYALTERVIFHHAKCAASSMLARLAVEVGLKPEEISNVGDELFFSLIQDKINSDSLTPINKNAAIRLFRRLKSRMLYKRILRITKSSIQSYNSSHQESFDEKYHNSVLLQHICNKVEKMYDLPDGTITIFVPKARLLKEARVVVAYDKIKDDSASNTIVDELRSERIKNDYPGIYERVADIESRYNALWVTYVFIDPEYFGYAPAVSSEISKIMEIKEDQSLELYLNKRDGYKDSKSGFKMILDQISDEKAKLFSNAVKSNNRTRKAGDQMLFSKTVEEIIKNRNKDRQLVIERLFEKDIKE